MNTMNIPSPLILSKKIRAYFLDLDLFQYAEAGPIKYGWILACYFSFSLGVYARQIVPDYNSPAIDPSKLTWTVLFSSFIVGLAVFPFALRRIIKQVTRIFSMDIMKIKAENQRIERFNILHVISSFAFGFFVDFIILWVPHLIQLLGR